MPTISKIRFANVIYEQGLKRYHDEIFQFDTQNGAILLENGGGKTVFIQAAMQAIIPHATVSNRQIKETFYLEEGPAHIAIEWLLNERPRQYVVTAVTLYTKNNKVESLRYVYEYSERDKYAIDVIPFTKRDAGMKYPASKDEIHSYFQQMGQQFPMRAKLFPQSIKAFTDYLETQYYIIREEWENMIVMNSAEGGIEKVFEECRGTQELFDRLLIPSVENADKYFNPLSITDQFEKQRSNLKKYKEFNEKKIEYKAMQVQLDSYVDSFRIYNETITSYEDERQQTAAYYQYLQEQKENAQNEVLAIEQLLFELSETENQLTKRQAALAIYEEQEKQQRIQTELNHFQQIVDKIANRLQSASHEKHSLEYAIDYQKMKHAEETIKQARKQLQQENDKQDIADLQNELEVVKGQWLFLLLNQKEALEKELQEKNHYIERIKEETSQLEKELKATRQKEQEARNRQTTNETLIGELTRQLEKLKLELVANENEQVEVLIKEWESRSMQLEATIRSREELIKTLQQQFQQQDMQEKQLRDDKEKLHVQSQILEGKVKDQQIQEVQLKEMLRTILHQISPATSIYDRASSYANQLQDKQTQLKKERVEKFALERKARRYLDDYATQQQFFAEPYLAEQMQHWSQFSLLQTGVEYLQALGKGQEAETSAYPFWAITLITTAAEKQALIDKVHVVADRLTTPIIILAREEARLLVQGEPFEESWIAPQFWRTHTNKESFSQWKNKSLEEAKRIESEREKIESKLTVVEQVERHLQDFLQRYSYEAYSQLTVDYESVTKAYDKAIYDYKTLEQKVEETKKRTEQTKALQSRDLDELKNLQQFQIPKAYSYMEISRKLKPIQTQLTLDLEEVERLHKKVEQLGNRNQHLQEQWLDLKGEEQSLQFELNNKVFQHTIYKEKDRLTAKVTSKSEHALKLEHSHLKDTLNQISTTIQQLNERIETNERIYKDYKLSLDRKLGENLETDVNTILPFNAEEKVSQLQAEIKRLQSEFSEPQHQLNEKQKLLQESIATVKLLVHQYGEELPIQTLPIEELQQILLSDMESYEKKLTFTKEEHKRKSKQAKSLQLAEETFRDQYFMHELNKIINSVYDLSGEQQTAFEYDYKKELERLFAGLAVDKKAVETQQQKINRDKQRFRDFCAKLQDKKLSKVTIDGIENRHSYAEITAHQQLIHQTIQQAIHIADMSIQEFDKDQQQIIQYAVQQLVRVRHNLLEIPKKTRIRTEEETKYIYQFTIPEWDEHEAKEAIRQYIDWILTTLEQDKYRDEYGNEDVATIRKFLEKHLQTVPLLRQVLGNKKMQVKCRKVESERQISSTFYSWEQSNKWSGGESWSKNMALYLGILKYIAEKAGGPSNAKRDRTLILDNPFGKASSDHVLSPVFYIAEQLGFQMIALTAHAEGKFIADYFPVVYSCRLRFAKNDSHQIIQKEQHINKAFFADQEPEALHYVGEKKQLSLFEE